ncbi:MAG: DUF4377 domain-containing protein [Bacteroidota bacterium]
MKQLYFILGALILTSCGGVGKKNADTHVYWVNSLKVPCVGVAPMQCLQVQKGETPDPAAWELFYAAIEGFEFEEGYRYKLLVKETHLDSSMVPADGSSIAYTLVKLLEREQDTRLLLHDIWVVESIGGENLTPDPGEERVSLPRLEINVGEMRYHGNDGCNNFFGEIIELGETAFRLGIAAGTRKMCPQMEIPGQFNRAVPGVASYKVEEMKLMLFDEEGLEVMRLKKVD